MKKLRWIAIALAALIACWLIGDFAYSRIILHRYTSWESSIERHADVLGYDMGSEPGPFEAMARARDSGRPVLSQRVLMVQDADQRPGFLMYVPLYEDGDPPPSVEARRRVFEDYRLLLADVPGISFMPEAPYGRSNRWLTTLAINEAEFGASRDDVIRVLGREGVEARPVWKPMHLQPVFAGSPVFGGAVSEGLFAKGLCLPSGTGLRSDQQEHICELIRSARQL